MKRQHERKPWVLTKDRKKSILRASVIHKEMVRLGKVVYNQRHMK